MITIRIKGGLGNQLFQYASAYALAKRLNQKLVLDTSFFPTQSLRGFKLGQLQVKCKENADKLVFGVNLYKEKYLNKGIRQLNIRKLPCAKNTIYLLETRSDIVPEYFTTNSENIYMDGYYQSEIYFMKYKQELIEQFVPDYKPEEEYVKILQDISHENSVAVHVRRGDFLNAQHDSNPHHYLLGEQYYKNALNYIEEHVDKPVFFWFSDDIEWVKNNFGDKDNFRYVGLQTNHADIDEMMLMKKCKHIIAANSTFSWWASWLNENENAIHVCPEKRYGNLHMIPETWIKLPV